MIAAYVINLDRAPERMRRMEDALRLFSVAFERVSAVDGKTLPVEAFEQAIDLEPGVDCPIPAQVGCFLSHRSVWEKIATGNADYGLVLEDDIVFAKNFAEVLNDPKLLAGEPDLVRLEGWPEKQWISPRSEKLGSGYRRYKLNWNTCGTGAYLISRMCARYLLRAAPRYTMPVDLMLFDAASPLYKEIDCWALVPAPCYQYLYLHGESDVAFLGSSIIAPPATVPARREKLALPRRVWKELVRTANRTTLILRGKRRIAVDLHPVGPLPVPPVSRAVRANKR